MFVNYAGFGSIVGHEISHGFDLSGSKYDFEGNLIEMWTDETRELYNDRIQCFTDQYNKIEIEPGIFVNGERTNQENTADNGGMAATIQAYKIWKQDNNIKINKNQRILPGLKFNEQQLWWISFGRLWCSVYQPGYFENWLNVHSPPPARLIGVVQNFKEFADAFKCPIDTPMNPQNKCGLWHN